MKKNKPSVNTIMLRNQAISDALYAPAKEMEEIQTAVAGSGEASVDGEIISLRRDTFDALLSNVFVAKYAVDKAVAQRCSAGETIQRGKKLEYEAKNLWEYARTGKLCKDKW